MTVLVELIVPADEFVLAEPLTSVPTIRLEIKRVVAGVEEITPYFWAFGGELPQFEQLLRADSNIREVLILEETQAEERFYRVSWQQKTPDILLAASEAKATILEAVTTEGGEWELEALFATDEDLARFHEYAETNDLDFQLKRVYYPQNPEEQGEYDLTPQQLEAVELAYERGYFNVPRDVTLTELATELDLSRNAVSARIRRGIRNVLSSTIDHGE